MFNGIYKIFYRTVRFYNRMVHWISSCTDLHIYIYICRSVQIYIYIYIYMFRAFQDIVLYYRVDQVFYGYYGPVWLNKIMIG